MSRQIGTDEPSDIVNPEDVTMSRDISQSHEPSTVFAPRPDGDFNIDIHRAEQRTAAARHKQQLESAEAAHRLTMAANREAQKLRQQQIAFWAVIWVLGLSLVISLAVALVAENDDRQEWAQSIVALIIGGVVGGLAGYITGQSSKP